MCICNTHVNKFLGFFPLVKLSFVSLIYGAPTNDFTMAGRKGLFISPLHVNELSL